MVISVMLGWLANVTFVFGAVLLLLLLLAHKPAAAAAANDGLNMISFNKPPLTSLFPSAEALPY